MLATTVALAKLDFVAINFVEAKIARKTQN
jgi:hypothetical protein